MLEVFLPKFEIQVLQLTHAEDNTATVDMLGGKKQKAEKITKGASEMGVERNDKKGTRWKKDNQESPDSGFVDESVDVEHENSSVT